MDTNSSLIDDLLTTHDKSLSIVLTNFNKYDKLHKMELQKIAIGTCSCWTITEFPTKELLQFIQTIINIYGIYNICEFFPRSGLLSAMIMNDNKMTINYKAYDNPTCNICSSYILFNNQTVHFVWNDMKSVNLLSNTLLIVNWPSDNDLNNLSIWLSSIKHKVHTIIVIGTVVDTKIITNMTKLNYTHGIYNVKRVSWNINTGYVNVFSCVDRNSVNIKDFFDESIFHKETKKQIVTINTLVQDLIIQKKMPEWIQEDKKFVHNICNMYIDLFSTACDHKTPKKQSCCLIKSYAKTIPLWLKNYDEILFWYNSIKNNTYPLITLKDNEKETFELYYKQSTKLHKYAIKQYKKKGLLPDYIETMQDAEKYILLDTSTNEDDKEWKKSKDLFIATYNSVFA